MGVEVPFDKKEYYVYTDISHKIDIIRGSKDSAHLLRLRTLTFIKRLMKWVMHFLFTELCCSAMISLMINVWRSAVCLFVRFLFLVMPRLKRQ